MLLATIWRSLRWRLLAATLLAAMAVSFVAFAYKSNEIKAGHTTSQLTMPAGQLTVSHDTDLGQLRAVFPYMRFLDAAWFELPGPSALFLLIALIVSSSGRLFRPGGELAYTFALPISRRRWLLTHAGAFVAAVAVVQLFVDVVLALGAYRASQAVSIGPLLVRSLGVIVAASAWVGVTIGALGLVRYPILAATLVLGALELQPAGHFQIEMPVKASHAMLPAWDPWTFADPRAWHGGVPVASLLVALALGLGGLAVGMWRIERMEP